MFDALHRTSLTLALAALPAARERRGMEGDGEDFADKAGSRALRARKGGAR